MFKLIFLISVLTLSAEAGHHTHFYRKDYTYFEDYDAFYKLHWDISGTSWNAAFMECDDEGSKLFYPREEGEWAIAKNLTSLLAETPNTTDVIVGIHDETGHGEFATIDGQSTPTPLSEEPPNIGVVGQNCVVMDLETGTHSLDSCTSADPLTWRLYVCKKIDERPCPTVDLGYKYAKGAKKCYKINKRTKTWQEAWHTCFMEGGILMSPDNESELEFVKQMIPNDGQYFAGFRRIFPGSSYYTVKGEKLEDSGFPDWRDDDSKNDCGVIWKSYNYNTLYIQSQVCQNNLPFICEMRARV